MPSIIITVDCDDQSDFDWLKERVRGAVEDKVADEQEDGRIDGHVQVSVDYDFGD